MVVAYHSRDLPCAILVLPEESETGNPAAIAALASRLCTLWIAEQVNPCFDRAVTRERIDGQRPANQIPVNFTSDVIPNCLDGRLPSHAQSALIVIELKILSEERREFSEITFLIGTEYLRVKRRDLDSKVIRGRRKQWREEQN